MCSFMAWHGRPSRGRRLAARGSLDDAGHADRDPHASSDPHRHEGDGPDRQRLLIVTITGHGAHLGTRQVARTWSNAAPAAPGPTRRHAGTTGPPLTGRTPATWAGRERHRASGARC